MFPVQTNNTAAGTASTVASRRGERAHRARPPTMAAMRALLISTYELGHQPLHVAAPAAALQDAGHEVRCLDLAVEPLDAAAVAWAEVVALSVPMHTAMRLAIGAARQVRELRPEVPVAFYGLYAAVGRDRTVGVLADQVISGEYEPALVRWVGDPERTSPEQPVVVDLGRHRTRLPARKLLPPLHRYAHLEVDGEHRLVGYVEGSHGCRHRCRHCPIPVVYDGIFRIVPEDVVLADVAQLVEMGAAHISYGDPDFLNGPAHARRLVAAVHDAFPQLTFDVTVKVEHILQHSKLWAELAAQGLLFAVSAFETTNDAVLSLLDKGHAAADAGAAVGLLRSHGVEIRPSWLPFTPWTSPTDVADILDFLAAHDLTGNVDPIQLTIRLLLPEGSLLLELPEIIPYLGDYDPAVLSYRWRAAHPEMDLLQARLATLVEEGVAAGEEPAAVLGQLWGEVGGAGRRPATLLLGGEGRPRLTEPWFC